MPDRTIVVKLRDELTLPYVDGAEAGLPPFLRPLWDGLVASFPSLTLNRLFAELPVAALGGMLDAVRSQGLTPPNLLAMFKTPCPEASVDQALAALAALPFVEYAELQGRVSLPAVHYGDDPLADQAMYLDRWQSGGVDALYAWGVPGGDGAGVRLVDVEYGWMLDHEDLVDAQVAVASMNPVPSARSVQDHGTSVLGIVLASDNAVGTVGIAPGVQGFVIPLRHDPAAVDAFTYNADVAVGIVVAAAVVGAGGVLLVELQNGENGLRPVEVDRHVADVISLVTALGVTVVEPAGNGNIDLDAAGQVNRLKRGHADYVDSGAVVVAAGQVVQQGGITSLARASFSTFGSRVDCHATSQFVPVAVPSAVANPIRAGYAGFGGTSGASAIVAGAAAAVQGMSLSLTGSYLQPSQVRALLTDPGLATLSANSTAANPNADRIGLMPDLRAIAQSIGAPRFVPLSVVARDGSTLDLAGVDQDDQFFRGLWTRTLSPPGVWVLPLRLAAEFAVAAQPPALVCRNGSLVDAFAVGADGALLNTWWDSGGAARDDWANIGPTARLSGTQPLVAVSTAADRIDLVAIRRNGRLATARCTADPHIVVNPAFQDLSSGFTFSGSAGPAVTALDNGGIALVAVDRDGRLRWAEYPVSPVTDAWGGMFGIGGLDTQLARTVRPAVVSRLLNLDAFAIGVDLLLYTTHRPGLGAFGWSDLGRISTAVQLSPAGGVAAVARTVFNLDVFVIDAGGHLCWTWWQAVPFVGWTDLEILDADVLVNPLGGITAISQSADHMAVFVHDREGRRRWAFWQEQKGWSALLPLT